MRTAAKEAEKNVNSTSLTTSGYYVHKSGSLTTTTTYTGNQPVIKQSKSFKRIDIDRLFSDIDALVRNINDNRALKPKLIKKLELVQMELNSDDWIPTGKWNTLVARRTLRDKIIGLKYVDSIVTSVRRLLKQPSSKLLRLFLEGAASPEGVDPSQRTCF
ncbi:MAG: hypothetical protein O2779_00700 [Nanoarchaeota archaeon]|nr:hypothetical protein [Nanoarchaeota archaeon]